MRRGVVGDGTAALGAPVDVLSDGVARLAFGLVCVLSLVLYQAANRGVADVLWPYRDTVGFVWRWQLPAVLAAVALCVLCDGGRSWRFPLRSSRRLIVVLSAAWLTVLAVATFGFDVGTSHWESLRLDLVVGLVMGVVAEELVFRGAVFQLAERVRPGREGSLLSFPVLVSGGLFALGHLQYWQFDVGETFAARYYTFALGLILGMTRGRSRSLWPPLAIHMVGNVLAVLAGSL